MFSLKQKQTRLATNKSKGFTIVELLIVIVVIGILATLVIVTFAGIQKKARDSKRQTDITAVQAHVTSFYAQYGYYPTLADLQLVSFGNSYLKGLDPSAFNDPKGSQTGINIGATASATQYSYVAVGTSGCVNTTVSDPTGASTTNNGCDSFTLTGTLENGGTIVKKSN